MKKLIFKLLVTICVIALAIPASVPAFAAVGGEIVTFDVLATNSSVTGLGTVHPDLNIQGSGTDGLVVVETNVATPLAYSANTTSQNDTPNGGLDGGKGFGDPDRDLDTGFIITFNGKTVSDFSIDMFDYGDWFQYGTASTMTHTAKLVAYDSSDAVLGESILTFTSTGSSSTGRYSPTYGLNLSSAGDALGALIAGGPGIHTFFLAYAGIAKVATVFEGQQSVDPGIAWDNIAFTVENLVETADITFNQTGVDIDFTGVILTVEGTDYYYGDLPVTLTFDVGAEVDFEYYSPLAVDAGKRYAWVDTTGGLTIAQSGTITIASGGGSVVGNYGTQFYLTVDSPYGTTDGEGWYDAGTNAYAVVDPLIVPGDTGVQYVFTNWSDDASGTTSPSDPILMDGPKTATAVWKTQYYLTVLSNPVDTGEQTGEGWYDAGDTATATTTNPDGNYYFMGWTGDLDYGTDPSALSINIVMDSAKAVTANYYEMTTPTGGHTIGFWSNKNGQALWATLEMGTPNPNLAKMANAQDMSVMLQAQLLATRLNIAAGFLDATQEVWVDDGDSVFEPPTEVMTIGEIISGAETALSFGDRAEQEYYKTLLDSINNNMLWFV
jgi:hypothetical protein